MHRWIIHHLQQQPSRQKLDVCELINAIVNLSPETDYKQEEVAVYLDDLINQHFSDNVLEPCEQLIRIYSVGRQLQKIKDELADINE